MGPTLISVIIIGIVTLLLAGLMLARRGSTIRLHRHFGGENDKLPRENGPQRIESVLRERERRVESRHPRAIGAKEREALISDWRAVQSRFVDDPRGAVTQADTLVGRALRALGYPVTNFDRGVADITVSHPGVVENYRAAHQISLRHKHGPANTEDLRHAILHYRSIFDELLQTEASGRKGQVA